MREQLHKIKQLYKGVVFDFHGNMLGIENNAVFIIVNIRGVLEAPLTAVDGDRNNPVVLSCGMVYASCIAFIFHTQLAFGVSALFCVFGGCNRLGILLRLGQVDGDIQISVLCMGNPFLVTAYAVTSDIVCILAEFVKILRCSFRGLGIVSIEFSNNFTGTRHKHAHDFCIEQIPVYNAVVFKKSVLCRVVKHILKNAFQFTCQLCFFAFVGCNRRIRILKLLQAEQLQKTVSGVDGILRLHKSGRKTISY